MCVRAYFEYPLRIHCARHRSHRGDGRQSPVGAAVITFLRKTYQPNHRRMLVLSATNRRVPVSPHMQLFVLSLTSAGPPRKDMSAAGTLMTWMRVSRILMFLSSILPMQLVDTPSLPSTGCVRVAESHAVGCRRLYPGPWPHNRRRF